MVLTLGCLLQSINRLLKTKFLFRIIWILKSFGLYFPHCKISSIIGTKGDLKDVNHHLSNVIHKHRPDRSSCIYTSQDKKHFSYYFYSVLCVKNIIKMDTLRRWTNTYSNKCVHQNLQHLYQEDEQVHILDTLDHKIFFSSWKVTFDLFHVILMRI